MPQQYFTVLVRLAFTYLACYLLYQQPGDPSDMPALTSTELVITCWLSQALGCIHVMVLDLQFSFLHLLPLSVTHSSMAKTVKMQERKLGFQGFEKIFKNQLKSMSNSYLWQQNIRQQEVKVGMAETVKSGLPSLPSFFSHLLDIYLG